MKNSTINLIYVLSFVALMSGCASSEDQEFPGFEPGSSVVVSKNEFGKQKLCEITNPDEVLATYKHLLKSYRGRWRRSSFKSYAPSYFIDFDKVEIIVLSGGLVITAPKSGYFFTNEGMVTFVKFLPDGQSADLIREVCAHADPFGASGTLMKLQPSKLDGTSLLGTDDRSLGLLSLSRR